jgi:hypothetical protein
MRKKWPPPSDGMGIECAKCGCKHHEILETREIPGGKRRRRVCRHCGYRWNTYEYPAPPLDATGSQEPSLTA